MKHLPANFLTWLSLASAVVLLIAWPLSYYWVAGLFYGPTPTAPPSLPPGVPAVHATTAQQSRRLTISNGELFFERTIVAPAFTSVPPKLDVYAQRNTPGFYFPLTTPTFRFLGFRYLSGPSAIVDFGPTRLNYHNGYFAVPLYAPALLFLLLPARRLYTHLRRRRRDPALCPTCAYNLTAHAPGQNCPECGTTIPANLTANPR
jgi:hypothetical protein